MKKKPSKIKRIWYLLTCWRPITKYEMVKMYMVMVKVQKINDSNVIQISAEIQAIKKQMGILPKDDKNNVDKGMYE